jgi:hypothetical protein
MTTYWAARFLAAAELERRGYHVSLADEKVPGFDLSVTTLTGEQFLVDVKGLGSSETPWIGRIKPTRPNLFYILVLVAPDRNEDRFFILSQSEWNSLVEDYQHSHPNDPTPGFLWAAPHKYEGQWGKLPSNKPPRKRRKSKKSVSDSVRHQTSDESDARSRS